MLVTRLRDAIQRGFIHARDRLLIRLREPAVIQGSGRPVVPRGNDIVEGQVLGRHGQRLFQIPHPVSEGLTRQAVEEIQVEVFETGGPGPPAKAPDVPGSVGVPQQAEMAIPERLGAQAQAIDAQSPQRPQVVQREGAGSAFQTPLGVAGHPESSPHRIHQRANVLGIEFRRDSSPERNRRDRMPGPGARPDLFPESLQVAAAHRLGMGSRVEVAVRTLLPAKGDMKINPQPL